MSIKKEMLNTLSEDLLKSLIEEKGISFKLSKAQREYYEGWDEKDKLVDLMGDLSDLSIKEIERYIDLSKMQNED
ncbi:MAG: hypothetical protein V5A68_00455 [Candidatus Thermoplasmatota archaeon]